MRRKQRLPEPLPPANPSAGTDGGGSRLGAVSRVHSSWLARLREVSCSSGGGLFGGDSTWHPRSGGEDRVWLPGRRRCFRSRAAAQEAWVRASSDILPTVLTSEKSRLGGNAECKGDTEPRPLSTDSREGRKGSVWGLGLVYVGAPDANSAGYTACSKAVVFPKLWWS